MVNVVKHYPLDITREKQYFNLPRGSSIIGFDIEQNFPRLTVLEDRDEEAGTVRVFRLVKSEEQFEEDVIKHIGSALYHHPIDPVYFNLHLFEVR